MLLLERSRVQYTVVPTYVVENPRRNQIQQANWTDAAKAAPEGPDHLCFDSENQNNTHALYVTDAALID